ncbi:MAG: MBL fold metallo-hydrolase [Clostridia bacterium]
MLPDSAYIQETETEYKNRKRKRSGLSDLEPLYTIADAMTAVSRFTSVKYDDIVRLNDSFSVRFRDAGHILGSASIEIWCVEDSRTTKIVFSGDIGKKNTPIIKDPSCINEADYLVMESTYGAKRHIFKENADDALFTAIEETLRNNGTVIIPSFAVGRTQEMIYRLNRQIDLMDKYSLIKKFPVYIDSPLAISATEVFADNTDIFDAEARKYMLAGDNTLDFPNLVFTRTAEESKQINFNKEPKIIISASGMCEAGRIKHHLKHNLWKKNTMVLFVGYQAPGTLGRRLVDGAKKVSIFGDPIEVRARIVNIDGFSGHGDMDDLDSYLDCFKKKPEKIFLVHGESDQLTEFRSRIKKKFNIEALIPEFGSSFELKCGSCTDATSEETIESGREGFHRTELINIIKEIKSYMDILSQQISFDKINSMNDAQVLEGINAYRKIGDAVSTLAKTTGVDLNE